HRQGRRATELFHLGTGFHVHAVWKSPASALPRHPEIRSREGHVLDADLSGDRVEREVVHHGARPLGIVRARHATIVGQIFCLQEAIRCEQVRTLDARPRLCGRAVTPQCRRLRERLGRKPTRNYWYGHSAGAYTALALIYMLQFDPQLNRDADGQETISGFIHDDPGGGLFLPMLERNGQDVLYRTAPQRSTFVKSLTLSHHNYPLVYSNAVVGEFDARHVPEGISDTALTNKRSMAKLFKQKELDGAFRMYEVRGISHFGDENIETNRSGDVQ